MQNYSSFLSYIKLFLKDYIFHYILRNFVLVLYWIGNGISYDIYVIALQDF